MVKLGQSQFGWDAHSVSRGVEIAREVEVEHLVQIQTQEAAKRLSGGHGWNRFPWLHGDEQACVCDTAAVADIGGFGRLRPLQIDSRRGRFDVETGIGTRSQVELTRDVA